MKRTLGVVYVFTAFFLLLSGVVFCQSFETLTPLLIDLPGWQSDKPEGADTSYGPMKAIVATRMYTKGDAELDAGIMVGQMVMGLWNPTYQEGFKMQTGEMMMEVKKIGEFLVYQAFDKEEVSGAVIVLLKQAPAGQPSGAVFVLNYEGIESNQGLTLAQKFDWAKMGDQANRFK